MFRKLGIGFTALAALTPGLSAALGVGDYQLHSYLDQPLHMEVELLDAKDLSPEEVLAGLGSERDFANAGVERVFFLNDLNFDVKLSDDGTGKLLISSRQAVREPYLNFIVELVWPTGRLLREYTVLLDPPAVTASAPEVSKPVAPVAAQAQPTPRPVTAQPSATPARPASTATSRPAFDTRRPGDYTVQAQDTLWRIALNNRPVSSISVQQMLLAIQTLNPDAFIDGNVNLVREGTVLRMPTEEEIRQISTRDALASVAEQNREWRAKLAARGIALPSPERSQVDGSGRQGEAGTGGTGTARGQVTLVADAGGEGANGTRGGAGSGSRDAAALENELAIRAEDAERSRREAREFESRLQDLQSQLVTSEKLLQLRDQQIAQLQAQLNELRAQQGQPPVEMAPVTVEPVQPAASDVASVPEVDAEPATEVGAEVTVDADGVSESDVVTSEEGAVNETTAPEVAAPVAEAAPVEPARPVTPVPAVPAEPSLLDVLRDNLLILLGVLVLVVLVVVMLLMRRRQQAAHAAEVAALEDDYEADSEFFGADASQAEAEDNQPVEEEEQDPLQQVDFYVTYGRFDDAVSYLRSEIAANPQRDELKVRLLEVQAEMGDQAGFDSTAAAYASLGGTVAATISRLQSQRGTAQQEPSLDDLELDLAADISGGGRSSTVEAPTLDLDATQDMDSTLSLDADDALDFTLDDPATAEASLDDEGLSLDLDDFTLDDGPTSASDVPSLEPEPAVALDDELTLEIDAAEAEIELSLDESNQADDELELDIPSGTPSLTLDDVGSDLSLDEDFGEITLDDASDEFNDSIAETPEAALDLSLDDLELDGPSTVAVEPAPTATLTDADATQQHDALDVVAAATDVRPALDEPTAALEEVSLSDDDDFDFLGDADENATKLDLAKAYIDMGDAEGARDILQEVLAEGNNQQQQEAKELLAQVG